MCLAELLRTEGGFNDIAADRGGATNFGISLRFLAEEVRTNPGAAAIVPPPITRDTIRALNRDQAARLYRLCFWDTVHASALPARIDHAVFCIAVNSGARQAAFFLQRAINLTLPFGDAVAVDRRIGQQTLVAARRVADAGQTGVFLGHYRQLAERRYRDIVARNPSQRIFLDGWLARARRLGTV
ncbi:glycoside hydrolase family 108 protein [Polymorphobacter sp.]|uniref:glycoside hydrolase family 108 protein n=1 Tax=Polymorphobacter sp. TaxID=1909290 RepID=UPI003F6F118C